MSFIDISLPYYFVSIFEGELPPPAGATKLPKSYYSKVTCSKCKKKGHNTRTCGKRNDQANNTQFGVEAQNVNQVDNSDNVLNSANHVANENGMPNENVDVDTMMQEVNHQTPTQQSEPVYVQSVASSQPVHLSEPSWQSFLAPTSSSQPIVSSMPSFSNMFNDSLTVRSKSYARKPPMRSDSIKGPKDANKKVWRP
ncbi:uncharacterized protein LOC133714478 [Rosa rugosa]|uniref:uncharacterized protein LOC133714478 n=1 Tax=Rosa rugosa TaxID=74645 RepID=UPI002B406148|nr:uncharacterized protein LOC133714478 [Rosa rugosa]